MKALYQGVFLLPVLVVMASGSAMAQSWKVDLGVNAGYAFFTPMLDEEETGIPDGAPASEIKFKNGWMVGAQLTYWFKPKFGLRLNGRYTDREVEASDVDHAFITSTNLWGGTADLMFRFKAPADEFTGTEVLPYLAVGVGAKWHNPGFDLFLCHEPEEEQRYNCGPFVTGSQGWALGEENEPAFLVGLGADWRVARRIAIRTEISDQFYRPQVHRALSIPPAPATLWQVSGDQESKWVHEIGIQAGLHLLLGLASVPVVAVAPPPPPPPVTPPPATPPPAAPTRETAMVCVIDPSAPGGIRMQEVSIIAARDTVVVVGGTDRPFRQTIGNVMVAADAPWYVQGQPLTMTVGTGRVEFATYGSARVVEANDIAYVGTINGFPVYADRDDVADILDELTQLNRARAGTDLGVILNQNRTLRSEFNDVRVLYVPTNAVGCVFQAVQRQEEVRKGGK